MAKSHTGKEVNKTSTENGFIKLHRKCTEWEWYSDYATKDVFIHLLLHANFKENSYKGVVIPVGSCVVGLHSISKQTGLSYQQVRTALKHLKSTNEITIKSTNKFSVVSIVNWAKYQGFEENQQTNQQANQQTTNKQLTNNQQTTNNTRRKEERKKEIKEEDIYTPLEQHTSRFIPPTVNEVKAYCTERQNNVDAEAFVDFYESANWFRGKTKIKDWKACVRTWEKKDSERKTYKTIQDRQKEALEKARENMEGIFNVF